MTKAEYMDFHRNFCERMVEITKKKNADYSGSGDDPFANFRRAGNFVQVKELDINAVGFLTRMSDKFSRIGSFISNGTLNYSALFAGYLRSQRKAQGTQDQ